MDKKKSIGSQFRITLNGRYEIEIITTVEKKVKNKSSFSRFRICELPWVELKKDKTIRRRKAKNPISSMRI